MLRDYRQFGDIGLDDTKMVTVFRSVNSKCTMQRMYFVKRVEAIEGQEVRQSAVCGRQSAFSGQR